MSLNEAFLALKRGADMLGLVSEMPSGPGVIQLSEIDRVVKGLPSDTKTVLLTSKRTAMEIIEQHHKTKTWGIQLVDTLAPGELSELRRSLPKTHLIQVIHVLDHSSIPEAIGYDGKVDMLLLDSGKPTAKTKTLGGTGDTHDWKTSREICMRATLPVLLAGGLNPENILEAVAIVNPRGVDLCSGVRSMGSLDDEKLNAFMESLKRAL